MSNNRNITQLPVNSNLSTIEGFAAVDISGANVQISGQSIIDSIDAVTSVLSSNTALLTVTGGNVPTITINTAPITKGGTGLATADQIVAYVATQTGGGTQDLQSVLDAGSTASITDTVDVYYTSATKETGLLVGSPGVSLSHVWNSGANIGNFSINDSDGTKMSYGGNQIMNFVGSYMLIQDLANSKGLEYGGAYKDHFTTYSLVDKDYVDTQIAGIGTPNLQQVMEQGSFATLGGGTNIDITSVTTNILGDVTSEANLLVGGPGAHLLYFWDSSMNEGGFSINNAQQVTMDHNGNQIIRFNGTTMTVTDTTATPKGLEYAGAYKANFTQYSLVDKDYVDTQIANIPPGGGVTIGSVGEIPFSNAAGTDFDYVSNIKTNGSQTYIGYSATFGTTANTLTVNNATGNNEVMMVRDRAGGDARLMTLTSEGTANGEGKEGLISKIYALGGQASHSRGLWSQAATVNQTALNNQNFYGGRFTGIFDDNLGYGLLVENIGTNTANENIGLRIDARNGQTNTGIQIVDGSHGTAGHVLTSTDVNGRGRWQAPSGVFNGGITASGIPSYADEAAASAGGLTTGEFYQTDGTAASPLNVAGILMIKQ